MSPSACRCSWELLCPASALSSNAFKTVMDIDTLGTFNVSRVLYGFFPGECPEAGASEVLTVRSTASLVCCRTMEGVIVNITAT